MYFSICVNSRRAYKVHLSARGFYAIVPVMCECVCVYAGLNHYQDNRIEQVEAGNST